MEIRPATVEEIVDLRHAVLRHGLPRESAQFSGDNEPTTRHFAALHDRRVIGCATLLASEWQNQPGWQVRGMAVDPGWQRRGIGEKLLRAVEQSAREMDSTRILWCNARVSAVPFYERHGWQVVSEEFDIPTAGPHRKMLARRETGDLARTNGSSVC